MPHHLECRGKLAGEDQDVVGEVAPAEPVNAAQKVVLEHERVIRLILHDVADADELRVVAENLQLFVNHRATQVHPADDAADDRVPIRKLEQPLRLLESLAGLHRDEALEAERLGDLAPVIGQEVALDRGHVVADPRVFVSVVAPQVDVRVDSHGHRPPSFAVMSRSCPALSLSSSCGTGAPPVRRCVRDHTASVQRLHGRGRPWHMDARRCRKPFMWHGRPARAPFRTRSIWSNAPRVHQSYAFRSHHQSHSSGSSTNPAAIGLQRM